MAFSSSVAFKGVMGNARVVVLSMVADSANGDSSATGTAGLGLLFHAAISPVSMATAAPIIKINKLNAGTTSVGNFSVSACATGDVFYVTLFGRS